MFHLRSAIAAGLIASTLSLAPAWAETPSDVLVVAQNIDDIVTIDPASAYEFSSGEYVANTYDTLVRYDATDTTVLTPALATEWTMDPAAKSVTFTLRDGVTFHSGNPLRAADVVGSWTRVVALDMAPAFILTQLGWTTDNIA
ncbi:MAG: ABC transporter substrate-binding protein, partial [Pseudomonadota bacterium]